MSREFVECTEIAGKTVKTATIYEDAVEGCETVIEFTDGTSFSNCVSTRPLSKRLYIEVAREHLKPFGITSHSTAMSGVVMPQRHDECSKMSLDDSVKRS